MIIRKATPADADRIAPLLLLAMEDIIFKFIGDRDQEKAKSFLLYFIKKENNQYSYQNCLVAEVGNEVVAAVNLYDGARLATLRQPVIEYIHKTCNKNLQLEDETGSGEFYIDSIGVNPDHRGKDIGAKLLRFLIDEYVNKQQKALGLLVDEENPAAKKLYLKLGFKGAGKIVFVGKRMEHLQINGRE
ncbi:MAG: GNAT family N-acetyltransferase [Bacteroidales bacterium]|nr:GNAT family N-acetyltransferase [Bacteroidales bacterium]